MEVVQDLGGYASNGAFPHASLWYGLLPQITYILSTV